MQNYVVFVEVKWSYMGDVLNQKKLGPIWNKGILKEFCRIHILWEKFLYEPLEQNYESQESYRV